MATVIFAGKARIVFQALSFLDSHCGFITVGEIDEIGKMILAGRNRAESEKTAEMSGSAVAC